MQRQSKPNALRTSKREDIHPLEEALGFKSLLELGEPYNFAHIAARSGKSEAYIYGRLKLADLIPPVAEAFLKEQNHHRPCSVDRQAPGVATAGSLRCVLPQPVDKRRQYANPDSGAGTRRVDRVEHPAATGISTVRQAE